MNWQRRHFEPGPGPGPAPSPAPAPALPKSAFYGCTVADFLLTGDSLDNWPVIVTAAVGADPKTPDGFVLLKAAAGYLIDWYVQNNQVLWEAPDGSLVTFPSWGVPIPLGYTRTGDYVYTVPNGKQIMAFGSGQLMDVFAGIATVIIPSVAAQKYMAFYYANGGATTPSPQTPGPPPNA